MTQIAIPDGFDLIYFSWDRLAPFPVGVDGFPRGSMVPSIAAFLAEAPRLAERTIEEDVERWDGLS